MHQNDFTKPTVEKESTSKMDGLSVEDKKFLSLMEDGTKLVDGHYHVPLLSRNPDVEFPNNRIQAINQLNYLSRRFVQDEKFFADYRAFIEDMISKRYAKQSEKQAPSGRSWYIPHHGVYHSNKPEKTRMVLDCSSEFKGKSSNHELMSGPDLTNQIVGVLLRFREEEVAFMEDIEAIFCQVKMPPEQRSYLRFLWWRNSDINKEVIDFEVCAHVFGGTLSPTCSNLVLRD